MESHDTMRERAFRYFDGKAGAEEEQSLYDFIAQDLLRLNLLKHWEREWTTSAAVDPGTSHEWSRLKLRLDMRQELHGQLAPVRTLLRRVASVAAAAIIGVCGLFGIWKIALDIAPAHYYTVEVPLGEKSRIVLSDGTVVWLNAGSSLRYSDRFSAFNRKVELVGEGYFEVTQQRGRAFRINTGEYDIRVTGTRFDVSAYPDDAFVTTTLAEGRVELLRDNLKIEMSPGESVRFDRSNETFIRSYVDPEQAYSWTENRIEFDNITLKMLVAKLSRQYNVRIHLQSENVKQKCFHISLRNDETIREVLDALKDIIPVRYEFKGDDIYVMEIND